MPHCNAIRTAIPCQLTPIPVRLLCQQLLNLLREVSFGAPDQSNNGQHDKDCNQAEPEWFLEHSLRQRLVRNVDHLPLASLTLPPGMASKEDCVKVCINSFLYFAFTIQSHSPAVEPIILLEALAPSLTRILLARLSFLLARSSLVSIHAIALETALSQLARPKQARIKVANRESAEASRVMATTLALLHLPRVHTFASKLTRIRLARLNPDVLGGQLGTVALVLVHINGGIQSHWWHSPLIHQRTVFGNTSLSNVQGVQIGGDKDG